MIQFKKVSLLAFVSIFLSIGTAFSMDAKDNTDSPSALAVKPKLSTEEKVARETGRVVGQVVKEEKKVEKKVKKAKKAFKNGLKKGKKHKK